MTYKEWISDENLLLLGAWARDGLTDKDMANNIGIGESTFFDWKHKHPEFLEVLKKNKEVADIIVENALYKRAIGYDYEEVKTITSADGVVMQKTITKKHIPADITAQIFWLKNRRPNIWRDKLDVESDEETKEQLKNITDAMLRIRESK